MATRLHQLDGSRHIVRGESAEGEGGREVKNKIIIAVLIAVPVITLWSCFAVWHYANLAPSDWKEVPLMTTLIAIYFSSLSAWVAAAVRVTEGEK